MEVQTSLSMTMGHLKTTSTSVFTHTIKNFTTGFLPRPDAAETRCPATGFRLFGRSPAQEAAALAGWRRGFFAAVPDSIQWEVDLISSWIPQTPSGSPSCGGWHGKHAVFQLIRCRITTYRPQNGLLSTRKVLTVFQSKTRKLGDNHDFAPDPYLSIYSRDYIAYFCKTKINLCSRDSKN